MSIQNLNQKLWSVIINHSNSAGIGLDMFSNDSLISDVDLRKTLLIFGGYLIGCATYIYNDECSNQDMANHETKGVHLLENFLSGDNLDKLYGIRLREKALQVLNTSVNDIDYSSF